jgi:hypothetical protein
MELISAPALCATIAILMDYTYLVVFMWTVVESVIMYISLVQVEPSFIVNTNN